MEALVLGSTLVGDSIWNLLYDLSTIHELQLGNCSLTYINMTVMHRLGRLQHLDLSRNNLSKILDYTFINHVNLVTLLLSHNEISYIESHAFQGLRLINKLDLTGPAFTKFQHLEIVDLRYNNISSLQPYNIKLSPLTTPPPVFYFRGNRFNCDCHLSWMIQCLNRWTDSCKGFEIDEFEFLLCYNGYKIRKYFLIKNAQLENMLSEFGDPCVGICDCCGSLSCICKMSCPANCTCLMSFNHQNGIVDCSNKHINNVTENIPTIAETLYLDGNNLAFIKSAIFSGLYHLKTLYLNRSGIDRVQPDAFVNLTKLEHLYLNENSLSCLDVELLN
ncbi:unnamed protein product [Mytilus edulis]|uniref:Uncharacterized protein n=1 Tax=Mytilus edulis TaxID=6550 RepID=A0A8S3ULK6_MYTED|nr:unnamed protein product [Mytilus edulis]